MTNRKSLRYFYFLGLVPVVFVGAIVVAIVATPLLHRTKTQSGDGSSCPPQTHDTVYVEREVIKYIDSNPAPKYQKPIVTRPQNRTQPVVDSTPQSDTIQ